jgi:phosphoribosylaminoimidazole-succinocarboxamide synthase
MSSTSQLHARGKVRDIYQAGRDLLLVATDRISAFDVILPTPIPDKGRVLTGLSLFWFDHTRELVGNHVLAAAPGDLPPPFAGDAELAGRSMLVKRADVIPLECVARGYLAGSGWKQYR